MGITREEIEKAGWLGDQRRLVNELLDRAELAEVVAAHLRSSPCCVAAARFDPRRSSCRGLQASGSAAVSGLIQSFSGLAVDCLHLKPEQVRYEDIPHTLAQKVRFNGHLREMGYSVAQHTVLGAEQMKFQMSMSTPRVRHEFQLAFLLHEVSEVYLPDVPAPLKPFLRVSDSASNSTHVGTWQRLENEHAAAMFEALGLSHLLPLLHSAEVKGMDRRMLDTEKRDLRLHEVDPQIRAQELARHGTVEPLPIVIERVWGPQEAKKEFNDLYLHLRRELAKS